jgi:hypothetical protein
MNERKHGYLLNYISDDYFLFTNTSMYLISVEEIFNIENGNAIKIRVCTYLLLCSQVLNNGDH